MLCRHKGGACLIVGVVTATLMGCGGGSPAIPDEAADNIKHVAVLIGTYARKHQGKMPANLEELKKFAQSTKDLPVPVTDKVFISPRDSQPYVIVPLGKMPAPVGGTGTIIVYEKTGAGGRRLVANELANVREVDEADFHNLVPKK